MHPTWICWLSRHSTFLCPMAKVGIFPIHLDPPTVEHRLLFRLLLGQQLYDNPTLEKRVWEIPSPYAHSPHTSLHHLWAEKYDTSTPYGTSPTRTPQGPECTSSNASVSTTSSQRFSGTSSIDHSSHPASRLSRAVSHSFGQEERMNDADHALPFSPHLLYASSLHSTAHGRHDDGSGGSRHASFSSLPHGEKDTPAQDRPSTRRERMPSRDKKKSPTTASASPFAKKRRCLLPREIRHDLGYMDDFSTNISTFSQLVPFDELILIPSTKFPLSLSQSVNLAALTVLGTSGIPHLHIDFTALEHPDETMPIVYQLVRHYPRGTVIHWLHDAYEMRSWLNFDWIKQTVPLLLLNTKSVTSSKTNATTTGEEAPEAWGGCNPTSPSSSRHCSGNRPRKGDNEEEERTEEGKRSATASPSLDTAGSGTKESSTEGGTTVSEDKTRSLPDTASTDPFPTATSSPSTEDTKEEGALSASNAGKQERRENEEKEKKKTTSGRIGHAAAVPLISTSAERTRWWQAPPPSSSSSEQPSDVVEVSKWYRGPLESSWLGGHPTQTAMGGGVSSPPHAGGGPFPPAFGGVLGDRGSLSDPFAAASTEKGPSWHPPPPPSSSRTSAERSRRGPRPGVPLTASPSSFFPAEERHTRFTTPPLSQEDAPHHREEGDPSSPLQSEAHLLAPPSPPSSSGTHQPDFMMEDDAEWMQQTMQLEASFSPATPTAPSSTPSVSSDATPTTPLASMRPTAARPSSPTATSHTKRGQEGDDASLPIPPPDSPVASSHSAQDGPFFSPPSSSSMAGHAGSHATPGSHTGAGDFPPPLFSSAPLDTHGMTSPLEVGQLLRELYPTLWSIPPEKAGGGEGERGVLLPHTHGFQWVGKGAAVPFPRRRGRRPTTPRRDREVGGLPAPPPSPFPSTAASAWEKDTVHPSDTRPRRVSVVLSHSTPYASVEPFAREFPSPRLPPHRPATDAAASWPAVDARASLETMPPKRHSPREDGSDTREEKEMVEELWQEGEVEEVEEEEGRDVHCFTLTSSFPYVEVFGVARHSGAEVRHLLWDQLADEARFLLTKTVWKYITTHGLYHNERRWSAAVTAVSGASNGSTSSSSSSFTSAMENASQGPSGRFRNGSGSNAEVEDTALPEEAKMSRGYFSFQHLHRRKKPFRAALRNSKILHISGLVPRLELHCDKNNPLARECCDGLNTFACPPGEQPDLIVPIGGDGYMMTCIREHWRRFIPFYGINAGHVGHLLNSPSQLHELFSFPINLHTAIMLYCQCEQPAPKGSPPGTPPKIVSELAFNDAWVERSSGQTAHIRIFVNGVERIHNLKGDGVLLSTAAGSTAYSRALGASPVPIDAPLIQIVGSNVVSPVQWRPAHLEQEDEVELVVLDGDKRPCRCFVDAVEVGNVQRMLVRSSHVAGITLAYSKSCDLQSKLYDLQFPGSRGTSSNGW